MPPWQVSLLNTVVELKKCCNHPFLFESAEHGYGGAANPRAPEVLERIILSSGKTALLDKLLTRLKETNHRVLIFSQVRAHPVMPCDVPWDVPSTRPPTILTFSQLRANPPA